MSNAFIPCEICQREFKRITIPHLRTHSSTMTQYREQFPNAPMLSETTKRKISKSMSGEKNHNFGKPLSEETRKKMSEARSGKTHSEETRKKIGEAKKGVPKTEEHRRKLSEAHLGKKHTEATRQKLREVNSGEKNHNFGKKPSVATRRKMSESLREGFRTGRLEISPLSSYGKNGVRDDLGHNCRSTWEANVARILKYEGIEYEYEPERFDLGEFTYLPDFYIPDSDLWVEVKGYMREDDQKKIDLFSKDHDMILIEQTEYDDLKDSYSAKVDWE